MKIETKYDVGQKVWVIAKDLENSAIEIFSSHIWMISIDGQINYCINENYEDYTENYIADYDDVNDLMSKVRLAIDEIKKLNENTQVGLDGIMKNIKEELH